MYQVLFGSMNARGVGRENDSNSCVYVLHQIRLSMCTASKLEGSLGALKRRLGLTLIKFEDAAVELEPFVRAHVFDTAAFLARQMLAHFKDVSIIYQLLLPINIYSLVIIYII